MNETLSLILSYLPAAASLAGSVSAAIYAVKKVSKRIGDLSSIKNDLRFITKRFSEEQEENEKIRKELYSLRMELKGIKEHGKESIKKN